MQPIIKPGFKIIGISIETTNKNMQAVKDIGALWQRFKEENIFDKIPNKISEEIYEVFTDYQGNYQDLYNTIIGCMVVPTTVAPAGMVEKDIPEQTYLKYIAQGKMPEAIGETWGKIWADDAQLNRAYLADFDVYGLTSQDPMNPTVDIFVGVEK